jgi:PAS domain S-box-containing protein
MSNGIPTATAKTAWKRPNPTGHERFFDEDEIIVSKTDTNGLIRYGNRVFINISGYHESELLGMPHSVLRHPDMPRCIFKLLWDTIASGNEIFAYVKNLAKDGSHYWVHAHVTPTFDNRGNIAGYHSNRRVPNRTAVTQMEALYGRLRDIEAAHSDWRKGIAAASLELNQTLQNSGVEYDQFIFSLEH